MNIEDRLTVMSVGELNTWKRVAVRLKTQLTVGKRTTLSAIASFSEYDLIVECIVKRNVVKSVENLENLIKEINKWGDFKLSEQTQKL